MSGTRQPELDGKRHFSKPDEDHAIHQQILSLCLPQGQRLESAQKAARKTEIGSPFNVLADPLAASRA
jgi:hypothetical protein